MRKIKFRAWNTEYKKMFDVIQMPIYNLEMYKHFEKDGLIETIQITVIDSNSEPLKTCIVNFIPMQYTGLKDKNGKEIYEGDIIKYYSNHNFLKESKKTYQNRTNKVVVFSGGKFYIEGVSWENRHYMKVIGNIYQNPELLK